MPRATNILITGAAGMLAKAVAQQLRARSIDPIERDRAHLDIADRAALNRAFGQHNPKLILNCAAFTKVDLCETETDAATRVNAVGAGLLARAARDAGAKLVHFSTDFVFNGQSDRPYRVDDSTDPVSAYGASKLLGEQLIADIDPEALIIRTSWLYGPGGPNFVQTMLNVARAGKKLCVVNDQIGSPTFTHDLADATLALIDKNARGIYHATNSGQTTWFDFAKAIFEEFNLSPELSATTSAAWKESHPTSAIRPAYSVLDCTGTELLIGRRMPDWRDALHRYRLATDE